MRAPPKPPTLFFSENTLNNKLLILHILVTPLRPAKGDASAASRGMPEIHRSTHPLSLRPTRRGGSRTAPTTPHRRSTPSHNNVSPLPRAISLPLPRGRLRGGPRVRATGRPRGPGLPTTIPTFTATPPTTHHPILPILSNHSHHSSNVSQFVPQFQSPFPQTQHLTSTAHLY